MDKNTYDLWMLAATWFSAIGTIGAVIVALRLASKGRVSDLEITNRQAKLGEFSILRITVINKDYRAVSLLGIQIRYFRFFGKAINIEEKFKDRWINGEMPKKLGDQEWVIYVIDFKDLLTITPFFKKMSPRFLKFFINRLKVTVRTTTKYHKVPLNLDTKKIMFNWINTENILRENGQLKEISDKST
jgi:hypothetical protein